MSEAKGMTKTMKNVEEIKDVILKFVISIMDKEMNKFELNYEENLFDLGMDSIKYVNLIVKLEMYYNIEFNNEIMNMTEYDSISKISEYVAKLISS